MEKQAAIILGAGITGLSAGIASQREIYEAQDIAGGICASYYIGADGRKSFSAPGTDAYRFELGGGHWIFGGDPAVTAVIGRYTRLQRYERKSAVYFPGMDRYVPYPIQNHLYYLPSQIRDNALRDILRSEGGPASTLAEWLESNFGRTLCELFFFPFHALYTANLYTQIAPQDQFKSPVDKDLIMQGAEQPTPAIGYNATFAYPERGMDDLIRQMAQQCAVHFNKKLVRLAVADKDAFFDDGSAVRYAKMISTAPLNKLLELAGLSVGTAAPYTSVLVFNIGARKGRRCPADHWLYIPASKSGFHRVGFYSNVDRSFVPSRAEDRVSIYVEKAYPGGQKPTAAEIDAVGNSTIAELQAWGFIDAVDVIDPTWIDVAYTWEYPRSPWKQKAIELLAQHDIRVTGRYGAWRFQGIMDSVRDGLAIANG
ncbi:MAG: FAD-dependent oxidoreductase [Candidatus Omnitrophica bacterium]|nr:FAD-dependent oxidoreductase [Candidatus Omnitrophota bacterium]